ncbi:MAG: hypothetical protein ACREXO_09125 [Advenella sp.]
MRLQANCELRRRKSWRPAASGIYHNLVRRWSDI